MDKKTLVKAISDDTGFSVKDTQKFLDSCNGVIKNELSQLRDVKIVGFGTYTTHMSKGRIGRNPKTGERVDILDKYTPKFKAGKGLKDAVHLNNIIA